MSTTSPNRILGKVDKWWNIREALEVLEYCDVQVSGRQSKSDLLAKVQELEESGRVTTKERRQIIRASRSKPSKPAPAEPSTSDSQDNEDLPESSSPTIDQQAQSLPTNHVAPPVPDNCQLDDHQKKCTVCFESLESSNSTRGTITSECNHESNVCVDCLAQYLTTQAESTSWDQMECPTCNAHFNYSDMKEYAPLPIFERLPNFRRCLNADCEVGQIHDQGDDQPIVTCFACGHKSCFSHKIPWHEGRSCRGIDKGKVKTDKNQDANDQRVAADREEEFAANTLYIDTETKRCPNSQCACPVQKRGGCQHMTCLLCGHQYCWDCLSSWDLIALQGNHHHQSNCPWHSDNLPSASPDLLAQLQNAIFGSPSVSPHSLDQIRESSPEPLLMRSENSAQIVAGSHEVLPKSTRFSASVKDEESKLGIMGAIEASQKAKESIVGPGKRSLEPKDGTQPPKNSKRLKRS